MKIGARSPRCRIQETIAGITVHQSSNDTILRKQVNQFLETIDEIDH